MKKINLSGTYIAWQLITRIQKISESSWALVVPLLTSTVILATSYAYFISKLQQMPHINDSNAEELYKSSKFFRDFKSTKNENELIYKILEKYDHISIRKLSNTNIYQTNEKSKYKNTETNIYFETSANSAQKIAANILNISPLIILNEITFSKTKDILDENPQINVKMDLSLITNRSFKV